MKARTANNVHTEYVEEAKAYQCILSFAESAEKENLPQIAYPFRAVASSERIHARRHFALLEFVHDTQTNLERAFQTEKTVNGVHYPQILREAKEDGEMVATTIFSQARDVEDDHVRLYKKALDHMIAERSTKYYACATCGYIAENKPPEICPICNAPRLQFQEVE